MEEPKIALGTWSWGAAASCELAADEMSALEAAAAATGVDTRGAWERPMV